MLRSFTGLCAGALAFACASLAGLPAQGRFVNYEDPQVKPIAIASVGSFDYVLACNTPDNSVEIYRAEWTLQAPIERVPVGLSPVTVKWDASTGHFYTCNYLGDSVTKVRLDLVPAAGGNPETVDAVLERTEFVGDEPTDLAFDAGGATAVVSLHSRGQVRRISLGDLSGVAPAQIVGSLPDPTIATSANLAPYVDSSNPKPVLWLLKQARRIEVLPDGRSYVLNTMGGEISGRSAYDMGLCMIDESAGGTTFHPLPGLGSTNFGMAVNAGGDRMYVVSQIAQNVDNFGVAQVSDDTTGFVRTHLQVVELPSGQGLGMNAPILHEEQVTGASPDPSRLGIDLNCDYLTSTSTAGVITNRVLVAPSETLAQVTDVILIPDPVPNMPERIVLAAFGSDRVAVLTEDMSRPGGYSRRFVDIPVLQPADGYSAAGPRGLAWSAAASQPGTGTAGLVFVLNRLDNSIAVVNPWTGGVNGRRLANDPTPAHVRGGRKFLYSAREMSGNGTVSCSSCHVDARTDGLRWRLGETGHGGPVIDRKLVDGYNEKRLPAPNDEFPRDKPETVTQTLQGLVDSLLEPEHMQFMATNAPYHWRGDKPGFTDFNEAFVNLQGKTPNLGGAGPEALGITDGDMALYESFINTIHHPPNPDQPQDRVYGGAEGDPNDPNDPGAASGALWGRKIFHIVPSIDGRSCVGCHSLPDGSSNTLTIVVNVPQSLASTQTYAQWHPMETAALRNIGPREAVLPEGNVASGTNSPFWPINGTAGLHHGGVGSLAPNLGGVISISLNDNIFRTFIPQPQAFINAAQAEALTEFLRQLDTGTAPMIGFAWTVTDPMAGVDQRFLDAIEQAHEANVGIAVFQRAGGVERGFWYDVPSGMFREESGATSSAAAGLITALTSPGDVLIVQVTPAGSERRVASLDGTESVLTGAAPANIEMLAMVPNTAYEGITNFDGNIDDDPSHPRPFVWDPFPHAGLTPPPTPHSQAIQREFADALAGTFGVPTDMRHEPPRRFRVAGDGIRNGARLGLEFDGVGHVVWFDLTPTDLLAASGRPIWETTDELDGLQTLALLCGGYWTASVAERLAADPTPAPLTPIADNVYRFHVKNEDGSVGMSAWGPLEITEWR